MALFPCIIGSSGGTETVLWTNPSPTTAFAQQAISLPDLSPYTHLKFYLRESTSDNKSWSVIFKITDITSKGMPLGQAIDSSSKTFYRGTQALSGNSLTIRTCFQVNTTGNNNSLVIPIKASGLIL